MIGPWRLLSLLLLYPDPDLLEGAEEIRGAAASLPGPRRRHVLRFMDRLLVMGVDAARREYVRVFDFDRGCCLELTYHELGDRRDRGPALLRLRAQYRAAGLAPPVDVLPDHLAALLELADRVPGAIEVVAGFRPALEVVRARLADLESPYAGVLEAVVAGLPRPPAGVRRRAAELAAAGPPLELVGLEPGT